MTVIASVRLCKESSERWREVKVVSPMDYDVDSDVAVGNGGAESNGEPELLSAADIEYEEVDAEYQEEEDAVGDADAGCVNVAPDEGKQKKKSTNNCHRVS